MKKLTRACPGGIHHYIPLDMGNQFEECRITYAPHAGTCIFGDHVDRLAEYEALGYEPRELAAILQEASRYNLLSNRKIARG